VILELEVGQEPEEAMEQKDQMQRQLEGLLSTHPPTIVKTAEVQVPSHAKDEDSAELQNQNTDLKFAAMGLWRSSRLQLVEMPSEHLE
jgi:hypothetical protein